MGVEQEHLTQLSNVKNYYNTAQKYYELVWYWRKRGLGLHYGLWTEDVHNRNQALVKENEVVANLAQVKPGDLVLDAGCGVAGSGIWLAQNKGVKVVGLNIVERQLRIGRNLAKDNSVTQALRFTEADYHRLPFASNSFNIFWSLESIEHSDDLPAFIYEARRILETGGRAVIAGTFKGNNEPTEVQREQLNVGLRAAGTFNDFRSAGQIAELMEKSGFTNIRNLDTTDLVMESAREMHNMCRLGLPGAKIGHKMKIISQIMVDNTAWGVYQEGLFKSGVTSYNILVAEK